LLAASLSLLALFGAGTNLWWVRVVMFICGYAMAHVFVPSQAAGFATISPEATGRASTLFNAQRQLGSAVGVAVLSTVVATVGPVRVVAGRVLPHLTAYHVAFLFAAGLALLAAVAALTVRDADAASTIVPRRRRPAAGAGPGAPGAAGGAGAPSASPEPLPAGS
jgi:MFS family permease